MEDFIINKTIRIATEFSGAANEAADALPPAIGFSIFYPAENYIPLMTGILAGVNRQIVQCRASNGFIISGDLITQVNTEEMVLRGNLFYGFSSNQALQSHFEGTIAIYSFVTPPVPPIPPDPPGPAEKSDDFAGNISIDALLFPYLYIQPWPAETPQDLWLNFIIYDAAAAPAASLYSQLIPLAQAKDRAGMEGLALEFVQNEAPFTGQYFYCLPNVPMPFTVFPEIYNLLLPPGATDEYENIILTVLGFNSADDIKALITPANAAVIDQVWQNYFALAIITGYNELLFVELGKILVVWNIIEKLYGTAVAPVQQTADSVNRLLFATVILPGVPAGQTAPVFPLPPYQPAATPATNNWIEPYAIGQLKMARYRLLRYQQGEVAHIQNVLKGEKKKLINRSLASTGEQTAQQNNNTSESINEGREGTNELLVEAQKTIAALTQTIQATKFTTTYGPPAQAVLDGTYSVSIVPDPTKPAKEDSNSFATIVLNKTLNRINEAVLKSRTFSKYSEREEISASIFDNTSGTVNLRGIYRWVNKVYKISVHNYGSRFLLELYIENPAAAFIASQESLNNTNLVKPLSPQQQNISTFNDITTANYAQLLSYYGVTKIALPPEQAAAAGVTLNASETEKYITIPEGYYAQTATVTAQIAGTTPATVKGIIGTAMFSVADGQSASPALNKETGQVAIAVIGNNVPAQPPAQPDNFILNATVNCTVTDKKLNEWKVAVFNEITEGYEKMIAAYDSRLSRFAPGNDGCNPPLLNNIERASLYRGCTDMLLSIAAAKTGSNPAITPPQPVVNLQRYVQFTGEAFEWDEMTYYFNDQPSKLSYALQGRDDSLRPFLQAASAVVFLPVRPVFNFQVLYYLSAGVIFSIPYPFVPVNDTDTATAGRLKKVPYWDGERKEEKNWNITLPTAMQVIQEGSQLPDFSLLK